MDTDSIRYFLRTAELQHFTNAAKELNVSQSTLSAHIKKLENELGCSLFDRIGKHVYLTEYGMIFTRHVRKLLMEYDKARKELADLYDKKEWHVTFTMPPLSSFPGIAVRLKEECPKVVFRNVQTNYEERIDALLQGDVDFCVMGAKMQHPAVESLVLSRDEMVILMPENHPLADQESISLSELRNEPFANVSNPGAADTAVKDLTDLEFFCKKAGFVPKIIYWCDLSYEVIETVRNANCLGLIPRRILEGYNTTGIRIMTIRDPVCYSNLRLYTLKETVYRKAVRQVIDCIRAYFKET